MRYAFHEFEIDLDERVLSRHGNPQHLQRRAFDVLQYLVTHPGLQERAAIMAAVWGDRVVTDNSLARCIRQLRMALEDDADAPRFIETVAGSGYRFIAPLTEAPLIEAPATEAPAGSIGAGAPRSPRIYKLAIGVGVFAITLAAALWIAAPGSPSPLTVAVLPFEDFSPEGTRQPIAYGFSEELLNRLSAIPELRVVARTSSFALEDTALTMQEIGELLSARYIIEGSIREDTSGMRVTTQLIDTSTGYHIWSRNFAEDHASLIVFQDRVAEAVAGQLQVSLVDRGTGTQDGEAYRHFLTGRSHLIERGPGWQSNAIAAFDASLTCDPTYVEALASRGIVRLLTGAGRANDPKVVQNARTDITAAMAMEESHPRVLAARGLLAMLESNYERALMLLEPAHRALPADPTVTQWLQKSYRGAGLDDQADAITEARRKADPLDPLLYDSLGVAAANEGDYPSAVTYLEHTLTLPRPYNGAYTRLIDFAHQFGRSADAYEYALRAYRDPRFANVQAYYLTRMGRALVRLGDIAGAQRSIDQAAMLGSAPRWQTRAQLDLYLRSGDSDAVCRLVDDARPQMLTSSAIHLAGEAYLRCGRWQEAEALIASTFDAELTIPFERNGFPAETLALQNLAFARLASGSQATAVLEVIDGSMSHRTAPGPTRAIIQAQQTLLRAHIEQPHAPHLQVALDELASAIDGGFADYLWLKHHPIWANALDDPGYQALEAQMRARTSQARQRLDMPSLSSTNG